MGVKFSQLPVATTIADDDYFAVLDTSEGVLKRSAISSLSPGQNITQAEYDELTPEQQSHGTYYITDGPTNGITVDTVLSKTSGNPIANETVANAVGVSMTQAEYDQLTPEEKVTGTYFLTDADGGNITVDQTLNSSSIHPISNSATATAVNTINSTLSDCLKYDGESWETKTWVNGRDIFGRYIWTDGENIYFSQSTRQYVLDKSTSTWNNKTWNGFTPLIGNSIWTDGESIYYSYESDQYVLDKATSTWNAKTWIGYTPLYKGSIWTDGENIYYSYESNQYVLNKSTSTWSPKTWNGFTPESGAIWTDGENIYYSRGDASNQYVLDKATSTWNAKTWIGLTYLYSGSIWTDGENIYCSALPDQYVLDKSTSTWNNKTWNINLDSSQDIWTDGENIYYSYNASYQYFLAKTNSDIQDLQDQISTLNSALTAQKIKRSYIQGTTDTNGVIWTNLSVTSMQILSAWLNAGGNTDRFVYIGCRDGKYGFMATNAAFGKASGQGVTIYYEYVDIV